MKRPQLVLVILLALSALACGLPVNPFLRRTPTPSQTPLPSSTPSPTGTLSASQDAAPVALREKPFQETNKDLQYEAKGVLPYLDGFAPSAAFNQAMDAYLAQTIAGFRKDAAQAASAPMDSPGSFLQTSYQALYNRNGLLSVLVTESFYMKGAAHPGSVYVSFNYDVETGRMLTLGELFKRSSDYLGVLSMICKAELKKRDFPITESGADPTQQNYQTWNITGNGLQVTFGEYQVGPYAAGPQTVLVPFSELEGELDPNGPVGKVK
jgi:hypothetical protein